ncbi:MAG: hypothetical protein ABR929_14660 [Roseiarcus sp.]|jgi:hypothetical protein
MLVAQAGEAHAQPIQQAADIVVGKAGAGAADKDEREIERSLSLYELRQLFLDDAIVVGLREDDRWRMIGVAMDVPNGRLAAQRLDHAQMIGPVGAVPIQRARNQAIVIGRGDAIAGVGELLDGAQDRGMRGLQAAELLLEEGAIVSAGRPAELRLNHVGGAQPVGDLVGSQQRLARLDPSLAGRPVLLRRLRQTLFDELRPPRRRAVRRRARNAGAADDQRPPCGDRVGQFFGGNVRHRPPSRRESRSNLLTFRAYSKRPIGAAALSCGAIQSAVPPSPCAALTRWYITIIYIDV